MGGAQSDAQTGDPNLLLVHNPLKSRGILVDHILRTRGQDRTARGRLGFAGAYCGVTGSGTGSVSDQLTDPS